MKKLIKIFFVSLFFICCLTVSASAASIGLDADDNAQIVETEYSDVDFFIPDGETEAIDPNVLATLSDNDIFPDDNITITLNGLHMSEPDFVDLVVKENLRLFEEPDDPSDVFFGLQGGCYDGVYYYFAFIAKTNVEEVVVEGEKTVKKMWLRK